MHFYRIYGIRVASSRPIGLLPEKGPSEIDLTMEWIPDRTVERYGWTEIRSELLDMIGEARVFERRGTGETTTRIDLKPPGADLLTIEIEPGAKNATVSYPSHTPNSDLDSYFVGPLMSMIMRLRGMVCLHASAIGINGGSVLFVGHSTAGKSTLAAGMSLVGARILADDISVLRVQGEQVLVEPGYTRVRLRPQAAESLAAKPSELPRVYSHRDSFYYAFEDKDRFEKEALPLSRVYIASGDLEIGQDPRIEEISPQERVLRLIENASGLYLVKGENRANEFRLLSWIAEQVPIRKFRFVRAMNTLRSQSQVILQDIQIESIGE